MCTEMERAEGQSATDSNLNLELESQNNLTYCILNCSNESKYLYFKINQPDCHAI